MQDALDTARRIAAAPVSVIKDLGYGTDHVRVRRELTLALLSSPAHKIGSHANKRIPKLPDHITDRSIAQLDLTTSEWVFESTDTEAKAQWVDLFNVFPALPLVDEVVADLRPNLLENTYVVCVQHMLGSVASQMRALIQVGLDPTKVWIIGKPNSTNPVVEYALAGIDFNVVDSSHVSPGSDFEADYTELIWKSLRSTIELVEASKARLLIIDDGGFVTRAAMKHTQRLVGVEVRAVEQTSSGTKRFAAARSKPFPLVPVGDAPEKLIFETPYITGSVVEEIASVAEARMGMTSFDEGEILVLGAGPVGVSISRAFSGEGARTRIFDTDARRMAVAAAGGVVAELDRLTNIGKYRLVVGTAGQSSLGATALKRAADGTLFVSASSSNIEFPKLVQRPRYFPDAALPSTSSRLTEFHDDIAVKNTNGTFWIASRGFPVYLTGGVDPITPHSMQLTQALMVHGIAVAVSGRQRNGLVRLPPNRAITNYISTPKPRWVI